MIKKILIINLGSTSTKISIYEDLNEIFRKSISHSNEELLKFPSIWDQKEFRKNKIMERLNENDYHMNEFDVISCRGGNVKPIPGGIYILNEEMIADMKSEKYGAHPTNVGNLISYELGKEYGLPVIVADPPVTDELSNLARISGINEIVRKSSFHALNQKRIARAISNKLNKEYTEINLIIVHMGGGISVGAHQKGLIVDVNNALDGDGPFSAERSGSLPVGDLIKMCYSGKYTEKEMMKKIQGNGGLMSYLKTNSGLEVEKRIDSGDLYAEEIYEAMAYQISKEIGAASTVLKGAVDAIVLTGSLSYSDRLVGWIKERVEYISDLYLYPGENEMMSLAENAFRFLTGKEVPKKY